MRRVLLFWLVLALSACATQVRVDRAPQAIPSPEEGPERVLVLPFAVYRAAEADSWLTLNMRFHEAVSDGFLVRGVFSVPYEDVLAALEDEGLLRVERRPEVRVSETLRDIYEDRDWSPMMRQEIERLIQNEVLRQKARAAVQVRFSLPEEEIYALGERLGARFVVRGRISDSYLRREDTLNPLKIGFLSAQNRALSRLLYGPPEGDGWGTAQEVSVGGLLGAVIGSNARDPFEPPHEETVRVGHPLFGETFTRESGGNEDYDVNNALFWGGVGAALSFLSAHGGASPEAVVGLTLYVYDVQERRLVWENRVRLRVAPQSALAPQQPEDLLLQAIEEAAHRLTESFWAFVGGGAVAASGEPPAAESEHQAL